MGSIAGRYKQIAKRNAATYGTFVQRVSRIIKNRYVSMHLNDGHSHSIMSELCKCVGRTIYVHKVEGGGVVTNLS